MSLGLFHSITFHGQFRLSQIPLLPRDWRLSNLHIQLTVLSLLSFSPLSQLSATHPYRSVPQAAWLVSSDLSITGQHDCFPRRREYGSKIKTQGLWSQGLHPSWERRRWQTCKQINMILGTDKYHEEYKIGSYDRKWLGELFHYGGQKRPLWRRDIWVETWITMGKVLPSLGEVCTEALRWQGARCAWGTIEGHWRAVIKPGGVVARDEVTGAAGSRSHRAL